MTKKVSRREFLRLSTAAGVGAMLAACGTKAPGPAKPAASTGATAAPTTAPSGGGAPTEVRYAQFTAPIWEPHIQKYVDEHNKRQSKYKCKFEPAPWGTYWPNVQTSLASGNPADVTLLVHFNMDKYVHDGACAPLDDFVKKDNFDLSVFYPSYVKHVTMGGKYYGIGWSIDSSAVFWNKDLFEKMEVEAPPLGGNWDWQGYVDTAKKITSLKSDGSFDTVGTTLWLNMNCDLPVDALYSNGGDQINAEAGFTKTLIGEAKAREAIKWAMNLGLTEKVAQASNPEHSNPWIEQWNSGRYGLHWGFANNMANFAEAPFKFDVVPIPVSPSTKVRKSTSNPNTFTMMAKAKNKEGAWDFLKWLASEDDNAPPAVWARDIHSLSPVKSVNQKFWMKQWAEEKGFERQVIFDSFNDHWRYPHFPAYADWYIPLGEELSMVFQGKDADQAIEDAVKRGDQILAENPTPQGWVAA